MTDRPQEAADYLEDAAAELRKAREVNESRRRTAAYMASKGEDALAAQITREVYTEGMRLAAAFTRLAAIKNGLLPPCQAPVNDADQEGA
jgi:hypothetical protein